MIPNLKFQYWIFETTSKFWAPSCKIETQPSACLDHGLHSILSSCWLAHCYFLKKSTKVHLYLGLDCRLMEFFTNEPQSKEQLMPLPHLWNTVWQKRLRLEHMPTVNRTSRRIGFNSAWSGSGFWILLKIFKTEIKKLKTYSVWCAFKGLFKDTTLMQIQSGRTVPLRVGYLFF
jgi:hypothetical protein